MTPRLKIYGGLHMTPKGQRRAVMAVHNTREVATAIGASNYYVRCYWCETGNKEEVRAALARPGKLIIMGSDDASAAAGYRNKWSSGQSRAGT